MKKIITTLTLMFSVLFVNGQAFTWMQKAPIPISSGAYAAVSFTINNLIYVAGGCNSGLDSNYDNLWEYDPIDDSWTQKATMPMGGTYGSSAFVINGEGYVVTGWHRDSGSPVPISFNYKYNPQTNIWSTIQAFPSDRYTSVAFELNGKGYLGTGYAPLSKDWWEYDSSTDSWTQKVDLPAAANVRQASHGFSVGGYGYLCMGGQYQVNYSDVWQYDALNNLWTQKANYPDTARSAGATFVLNNKAYLMGGSNWAGDPFASIYCYEPGLDQWTFVCYFPGGKRLSMVTATANGKVYMGQGSYTPQTTGEYLTANDWWECSLVDANVISGKVFVDFNNNQVQDNGEFALSNKMISETNSGRFTFTRQNGSYDLSVIDSGNFIVTTDSFGYYFPNPSSQNVYFDTLNQKDSLNDFAMQASGIINDLCISITPGGNFRAGMDAYYTIDYSNSGTTTLSPTVIFFLDSNLAFVSASVNPTSATADSVVWDLSPLTPFEQGSIQVTTNVSIGTPIGTPINSSVMIEPVAGDANPECNYDSLEIFTTGSYDPNDIVVSRETLNINELSTPPYLDYIINFQNTGNDTAFNVDIINSIPVKLELNSFEIVSASHPVNVRYIDGYSSLGFKFDNIFLPDSNVNERFSHGFVHYRIKPLSSLIVGDQIENTAAIYFDFNAAVLTNTVVTTIVNPLSVPSLPGKTEAIKLYPNPNNGTFYLAFNAQKEEEATLKIFDVVGKSILNEKLTIKSGVNKINLNKSSLEPGIYFIKMNISGKTIVEKVVVNK